MRRNDLKNPKRSSNTGHVVTKERSGETNYRKRRGKRLGYCWFRACSLEETRHRAFNGVSRTISYLRKQRCKWGVARFSFRFVSFRGWKKHGSPFPPPNGEEEGKGCWDESSLPASPPFISGVEKSCNDCTASSSSPFLLLLFSFNHSYYFP